MTLRRFVFLFFICILVFRGKRLTAAEPGSPAVFAKNNLIAWCIVPFDSKKRGPEERAAMLEKLGFSKFAYDYRSEHIPTFDAEIEALKRHHVELTAWWFPTTLNEEATMTLKVFERHQVTPQLWVTGSGEATKSEKEQKQRIRDEANRIRPIAEAAAKIGCKVALYNHGGWFGEPENQIAIIQELKQSNVGLVYNQHHGHDHLDRFPELLQKMKPYLYALNLNGMIREGDRKGQKILQLGQGNLDLSLLKVVRDSGYSGPIGILGHTLDDAEERLRDNLDGLNWLLPQLEGKTAGPIPQMRTPIPVDQTHVRSTNLHNAQTNPIVARLTEGKFGKAIDGRAGGAYIAGGDEFRQFPLTVECWTKLSDKEPYNILVAHELKTSGTHWEIFSMTGSGHFTAYTPGFTPDHCHSNAMICDGKWHHVAMVLEPDRIQLFVDGRREASQSHQRTQSVSVPGDLALATLVDHQIGCTGLVDEIRISRGTRSFGSISERAFVVDDATIGLWHLDELVEEKQYDDSTRRHPALLTQSSLATADGAKRGKIEGHWGEDALGFRWTEQDSRDDRFGQMDTGPFFSGSITGPGGIVYKGIVVRLGEKRTASICYDTELMRASAGWTGFLRFDAARFGIIVPPRIEGDVLFSTPLLGGWSRESHFSNFRATSPYGGIPKDEAHYEGLYRHGQRVVMKFSVGNTIARDSKDKASHSKTMILESPWLEEANGISVLTRTLSIEPSTTSLSMLIAEAPSHVRLIAPEGSATLTKGPGNSHVLLVPPHEKSVSMKLFVAATNVDKTAFDELVRKSSTVEDLVAMTKPGPTIWGEPLVTSGEVSTIQAPLVIDTLTLPFENPFRALMFCGGHDFFPDGRALVCTLHGDVWLVDGIDDTLKRITWRRFATGLFQPLGLKLKTKSGTSNSLSSETEVYVAGRDQITRLHDTNGDGEADFYENFNNDAYVSLNGHEYVTCLETDRAGNFYFVKGNCDSAIPHDGSLLRVSADGSNLDVYATGFRNSNGIGIGPDDEITVSPQEGEWTPASAVFAVHQGGFYGAMMSHHKSPIPTDFERPFCWFPRLADNSSGGQVWVPANHWGSLGGQLLHLSYGQCELRLLLREPLLKADAMNSGTIASDPNAQGLQRRSSLITMNGGSTELPLTFASGIHRGRFNSKDGHLYLTGLKGWVTSAVNDGCFQRVRYTGQPMDLLIGMKTYRNGIALTFTQPLNREEATQIDNYQVEEWNYHWSSAYGSPDLRPSAPGQVGRDAIEPKSVTLLDDNRTVFLEFPDLKPVDQVGISYSLRGEDGAPIEQTAYFTLNGIPDELMPEHQLRRSESDLARLDLISRLSPGVSLSSPALPIPLELRMLAWPNLKMDSAGMELTATGYLKVPASGQYRFQAAFAGTATLEINGDKKTFGETDLLVTLRKGFTKILLRHSPPTGNSQFRLLWESERFPREAIPAALLFHETIVDDTNKNQQKYLEGRELFVDRKCAHCHKDGSGLKVATAPEPSIDSIRQAPRLQGIGSRLSKEWLTAWSRNPSHVRPDATMPEMLNSLNEEEKQSLVTYLVSLKDPGEQTQTGMPQSIEAESSDALNGEILFERLACIACHSFDSKDEHPDWNRIPLQVGAKYLPGQLARFLEAPHRHHVGSRMPDFHLSKDEIRLLTAHIERNSRRASHELTDPTPISNAKEKQPVREIAQGQKLFAELRCRNCHQVSPDDPLNPPDVLTIFGKDIKKGCLGDHHQRSKNVPLYNFTASEREALTTYLTLVDHEKNSTNPIYPLHRLRKQLRCQACHALDGSSAFWPEIVSEVGSGKIPEPVPQLTWVGEKLQGSWVSSLLKGDIKQKPRPWMIARMPGFPEYADVIAHAMADEHGVNFVEPLPTVLNAEQIEHGRLLTMRDGGLDCRQCHGVGKEAPKGDTATQIALGINFAMIRSRLRPEFTLRQLLDPPRYDVGSRMPRFAMDLQTTAAKHIEGGDAKRQFEAIKHYLWSLKLED